MLPPSVILGFLSTDIISTLLHKSKWKSQQIKSHNLPQHSSSSSNMSLVHLCFHTKCHRICSFEALCSLFSRRQYSIKRTSDFACHWPLLENHFKQQLLQSDGQSTAKGTDHWPHFNIQSTAFLALQSTTHILTTLTTCHTHLNAMQLQLSIQCYINPIWLYACILTKQAKDKSHIY